MYRAQPTSRKYEEHAYVLDFNPRGKSTTVRGREGIIITAIGEDRLTLLEVLGIQNSTFEVGEKIYIGKDGRTKISSVLGKMDYEKISSSAQSELSNVIEKIVTDNEVKFVKYLNNAQPLTPRIHALELIPGIGKTYMKTMLEEREKQIDAGKWDYRALMVRMSAWSTNPEYAEIILQAIVDNKLP